MSSGVQSKRCFGALMLEEGQFGAVGKRRSLGKNKGLREFIVDHNSVGHKTGTACWRAPEALDPNEFAGRYNLPTMLDIFSAGLLAFTAISRSLRPFEKAFVEQAQSGLKRPFDAHQYERFQLESIQKLMESQESRVETRRALCDLFNRELCSDKPTDQLQPDNPVFKVLESSLARNPVERLTASLCLSEMCTGSMSCLRLIRSGAGVGADPAAVTSGPTLQGSRLLVSARDIQCLENKSTSAVSVVYIDRNFGYGVFAEDRIESGKIACVYSGQVSHRCAGLHSVLKSSAGALLGMSFGGQPGG